MHRPIHRIRTRDGLELPVVDVTHPSFRVDLGEAEQRALVADFVAQDERLARLPRFLRRMLLRVALRRSVVGRGILASRGTFLSALGTYLLKLRPEDLGPAAAPIDRRILTGLPAVAARLRLQDMARLMAEALLPRLRAAPGRPLHFLDLAGGTAIDALNALLVLRSEAADVLARPIAIDVLDRDAEGPELGRRALRALQEEGAPLHGTSVELRHLPWDWAKGGGGGATLSAAAAAASGAGAIAIASSEGGLFEYGADGDVVETLTRLRGGDVVAVVGSVTRADDPVRRLHRDGGAAIRPRGLEVFRALVAPAGWRVQRAIERPFSDHVTLTPAPAARAFPGEAGLLLNEDARAAPRAER